MRLNTYLHTDEGFSNTDEYLEERGKYKLNQTLDYGSIQYSPSLDYEIFIDGLVLRPGNASKEEMEERKKRNPDSDYCWRWSKELFEFGKENGFIVLKKSNGGARIYTKTYENARIVKSSKGYEIEYAQRTRPVTTLEFIANRFSNDNAKKDLFRLFNEKVFDYSKPLRLMSELVFLGSDEDSIILDFFAGSSTLAQATFKMNFKDGGKRKFIMVQLPEPTDKKSDAYIAGYENICEIGKERIRRAGEQIKAELQTKQTNQPSMLEENIVVDPDDLDIGFKVFKLDSSNLKKWNPDTESLETSLLDAIDNYVEGRSELDVVYEIMLKYGIDLTLPLDEYTVGGKKIYSVGYGALMICLDSEITTEVANEVVRLKNELKPEVMRVVFKDNGFKDDSVKTNTREILRNAGIDEIVSV